MSYAEFLKRLATFSPTTWIGVSLNASPLVCARYGWRNAAFQILKCDTCGAEFPLPSDYTAAPDSNGAAPKIEALLSQRHKEGCIWKNNPNQLSYTHLQLSPLEEASRDFLERLDGLNCMWDLPKINDLESDETQEEMKHLLEFLHERRMKYATKCEFDENESDVLKRRLKVQMILALLGWNLKWTSRLVYTDAENGGVPSFVEGQENNPSKTRLCFARQCYIACHLCNAKIGLWNYQTEAPLDKKQFQQLLEKLKKPEDTPILSGIKRKRKAESEAKETGLKSSSLQGPAFGLKRFKRTREADMQHLLKLQSITRSTSTIHTLMREEEEEDSRFSPILSGPELSAVQAHRFFCPFRTDWGSLLKALVGS